MASYSKESDVIQNSPAPSSETSSQLDDTYEAYKNNQGADVDPIEVKKTLKKIDIRIVPILFFTYLLQYLDKNGINYASAFGLQEGTNLKGQDYSWLGICRTAISTELRLTEVQVVFSTSGIFSGSIQPDTCCNGCP